MINEDPRKNLPPKTLVIWRRKLYRTVRRVLIPTKKPGIGRVWYVLEPGGVLPSGEALFGLFKHTDGAAARAVDLELVGDRKSFDPSLGHKAL